jgi:polysaccharide pyruvyl transferase WcaK-like protein
MLIGVVGEVNSSNIGDKVIADSLSYLLGLNGAETIKIDLSMREDDFSVAEGRPSMDKKFRYLFKFFRKFLRPFRIFKQVVNGWALYNYYNRMVRGVDLLIVGGGNLLIDNKGDFPLKVYLLCMVASRLDIPLAFFSVGVGSKWSHFSRFLLSRSLKRSQVKSVYVRDALSAKLFLVQFPEYKKPLRLTFDVALACENIYVKSELDWPVGVGVIAPTVVKRHCRDSLIAGKLADQFWVSLISQLQRQFGRVAIFTNGELADYEYAKFLADLVGEKVVVLDRPKTAAELNSLITRMGCIVASRLHASIIAVGNGLPSVGIVWDKKVAEFYKSVGLSSGARMPEELEVANLNQILNEATIISRDGILLSLRRDLAEVCAYDRN